MDPIRVGVIGAGNMADAFARDLALTASAEIVAVASRTQRSASEFAKRHNVSRSYTNGVDVARDTSVDLVYVATPHTLHCENTLDCLDHGKAVLCEKPFAVNADQASHMVDRARSLGLFLMEAMWTRHVPALTKLRSLIAESAIGKIQLMVGGGAFIPEPEGNHYLFDPERAGGVLLDAGVYLVSMASQVFGPPASVSAELVIGKHGVDEQNAVVLRHTDGSLALLYVSMRARSAPEFTLLGDAGKIDVHPPIFCPRAITLHRHAKEPEIFEFDFPGTGYQFQIEEAVRCLQSGERESPYMPLDESLQIMKTLDHIRRASGLVYPMEEEQ